MAEALHVNFYHNFMSKEGFDAHRETVLKSIERLRELIKGHEPLTVVKTT